MIFDRIYLQSISNYPCKIIVLLVEQTEVQNLPIAIAFLLFFDPAKEVEKSYETWVIILHINSQGVMFYCNASWVVLQSS